MKKIFFIAMVIAFASCTSKQVTYENISANGWKLVDFVCDTESTVNEDMNMFIKFTDSVSVAGNTQCNRFRGKYAINEYELTISNIGSTKMFCGEDKEQFEQNYLNALSNTFETKISSNGEELILTNKEKGVEIKYIKFDGDIPSEIK